MSDENVTAIHTPASPEAFRAYREAPAVLELPDSGLVVHARRCHINDLAAEGAIPNRLSGIAMRVLGMPGAPPRPASIEEAAAESRQLIDVVTCAAMVAPRVVPDDAEELPAGAIRVSDMPYPDREHVFAYVCRLGEEARDLSRFPGRPDSDMAAVAAGARVQGPAE